MTLPRLVAAMQVTTASGDRQRLSLASRRRNKLDVSNDQSHQFYNSSFPLYFAIIERTLSRSLVIKAPSSCCGSIGFLIVTINLPGDNSHSDPRQTSRTPFNATGQIGIPFSVAKVKAPNLKCQTPRARVNVPSG